MYLQYLLDTLFVSCKAFVNVPTNFFRAPSKALTYKDRTFILCNKSCGLELVI